MGQFDTETDAALTQLNYDALSETPGGEFVEIIGDLLKLVGGPGPFGIAGGVSNLLLKVRKLAGASYASNLVYAITAVRNDLKTLFETREELRERIEALPTDSKFVEAISALALRAMHTSVKARLKRLSRIVVNGVKEDDLELESTDDLMRACVELKDYDIDLLANIYEMQIPMILSPHWAARYINENWNILASHWQKYWDQNLAKYRGIEGSRFIGSFSRLESFGMIAPGPNRSSVHSPVATCYLLLSDGVKFYERLQEIAVPK